METKAFLKRGLNDKTTNGGEGGLLGASKTAFITFMFSIHDYILFRFNE